MGDVEQLHEGTTVVLFILDALDQCTDQARNAAADDLVDQLTRSGPDVRVARRLLAAPECPVGQL